MHSRCPQVAHAIRLVVEACFLRLLLLAVQNVKPLLFT